MIGPGSNKNVALYKWSLPALCSTEKSAGSPNVISQQGLATCFPHKYSSVAKLRKCNVYATYEFIDYREPGTKKATNGLKRDRNGLIHCNVSLMKVLASFVEIKKPLPPCQITAKVVWWYPPILQHSGYFFLFPGSAQSGIEAEALRPEVFYTSLLHWPASNEHALTLAQAV